MFTVSYFCGRDNIRFSEFIEVLVDVFPSLTLERAIQCISAHSKKGVLLLVDELLKSTALAERIKLRHVVSQLGNCLDNFTPSEFNVVVTTLTVLRSEAKLNPAESFYGSGWHLQHSKKPYSCSSTIVPEPPSVFTRA